MRQLDALGLAGAALNSYASAMKMLGFGAIVVAGSRARKVAMKITTVFQQKFVQCHVAGKIAAFCHGCAVLRYTRLL